MTNQPALSNPPFVASSDDVSEAGGSNAAVLDPQALQRLAELDPKGESRLLDRVLNAFKVAAARLMPQLEAARRSGDIATIRLVAHTLKSSSGSIGATRLSRDSAHVEALVRDGATDALAAGIDAMDSAMAEALQAIEQLLEGGA